MAKFVALLRGVNVGKGNRLPMADWRALIEAIGGRDVRTLLNSGNAVFSVARGTPAALAGRMHDAIAQAMDLDVFVVVKSAAQWRAVCEGAPSAAWSTEPSRMLVVLAPDDAGLTALAPLQSLCTAEEHFSIGAAAAYLACPGGLLESKAASALLGKLGRGITTRNWATVQKLYAMVED